MELGVGLMLPSYFIMVVVIETAEKGKWFWLRVWLYCVPTIFMVLASSVYWIAPQVNIVGHAASLTFVLIGLPFLVFQSKKFEREHGLSAMPNRMALLCFFGGVGLLLLIGFTVRWQPKNLLGLPVTLGFLALVPSFAVTYNHPKADQH